MIYPKSPFAVLKVSKATLLTQTLLWRGINTQDPMYYTILSAWTLYAHRTPKSKPDGSDVKLKRNSTLVIHYSCVLNPQLSPDCVCIAPYHVRITSVLRPCAMPAVRVIFVSFSHCIRTVRLISICYSCKVRLHPCCIRVKTREHCLYHVRLWIWLKSRVLSATDNNLVVSVSDPWMCKRTMI